MKKGSKRVLVSKLKGLQLYNYIFKQVGVQNRKQKDKQQIGQETKRKKASLLYNRFKKNEKYNAKIIIDDVKKSLSDLPPIEICNPLYLSAFQLLDIEYYQIDDHLRSVLPDCLDVKLNAGSLGYTRIFNTKGYTYYTKSIKRIVENIRDYVGNNDSGQALFSGIVKLKRGRPNDGSAENYFVEFILFLDDKPFENNDFSGVDYELPKSEKRKKEGISNTLAKRVSALKQKRKKQKIEKGKIKSSEEKQIILKKELNNKIASVRREEAKVKKLYLQGVISKSVYNEEIKSLEKRKLEIRNRFKTK
jgi:hypothetical protein